MVIGKSSPIPDDGTGMPQRFTRKDCSSSLRHSESGMVDSVLVTTGADGQRFVKMRVSAGGAGGSASAGAGGGEQEEGRGLALQSCAVPAC